MGLAFPAGKELEKLARLASGDFLPIPSVVKMGNPSFSGPLSAAMRLLEQGVPREQLAASVLRVVANSLEKSIRYAMDQTGIKRILLVGGVASNQLIRERLHKRLGEGGAQLQKLYFSDPYYASDNAYGVALIARSCEES
jgi:N6-L-threonylcarbamoyladenine synthase